MVDIKLCFNTTEFSKLHAPNMLTALRMLKLRLDQTREQWGLNDRIKKYIQNGRIPWSNGYLDFRSQQIKIAISNYAAYEVKDSGVGLDERIVEIPWTFKNISLAKTRFLDAGSSLNHDYILDHELIKTKDLTICTYHPEPYARHSQRISYVFADLRNLPFKDQWFEEIVCISTLEHIDMDNSMYGYKSQGDVASGVKSYSFLKAIDELNRVLKQRGQMLITVPFGKFENHGFFQQFDNEMIDRIADYLKPRGENSITFFRYTHKGWVQAELNECLELESFNPHTGKGKKEDGAAHCRAIACFKFLKS